MKPAVERFVYTEDVTSSILVSPMKFYNAKDFEMNPTWDVQIHPWRDSFILHIDNIYKNPDNVYEYLDSIGSIRTHKTCPNSKNGIDFMDGQMLLDNRWDQNRKHLLELIAKQYGVPVDTQNVANTINQFRLILTTQEWVITGILILMVKLISLPFLNKDHHMKSGTSLYIPMNTKAKSYLMSKDTEHSKPWRTENIIKDVILHS